MSFDKNKLVKQNSTGQSLNKSDALNSTNLQTETSINLTTSSSSTLTSIYLPTTSSISNNQQTIIGSGTNQINYFHIPSSRNLNIENKSALESVTNLSSSIKNKPNINNLSKTRKQLFQHNKNFSLPTSSSLTASDPHSLLNRVPNQQQTVNYLQTTTSSAPTSKFTTRNNTLTHPANNNNSLEVPNKNEFRHLDSNLTNPPKFTFKRQLAVDFPVNQLSHSISATSSTTASSNTLAGCDNSHSLEILKLYKTSCSATNLVSALEQTKKDEKNKSDTDVNKLSHKTNELEATDLILNLSSTSFHSIEKNKNLKLKNGKPKKSRKFYMSNNQDDQKLLNNKHRIDSSFYFGLKSFKTHRHQNHHYPSANSPRISHNRSNHRSNHHRNSQSNYARTSKTSKINLPTRFKFGNFFTRTSNQLLASLTGMKRDVKSSMPAIILTPNNSLEKENLSKEKRRSTAQLITSSGSNSEINSCCSLPMDQRQQFIDQQHLHKSSNKQQNVKPQTVSCEAMINLGTGGIITSTTTCSSSSTNTISQPNQYSSLNDYHLRLIANYDQIPNPPPPSATSWYNNNATNTITRPNSYLYRQRTDDGELRKRKQEQWLNTKQASIASQALSACETSTGFLNNLMPSGISSGRTLHKSFDYAYNPLSTMISNQLGSGNQGGYTTKTVYHSTGSVPTTNILSTNANLINNANLKKAGSNGQEIKSRTSLTSEQMKLERNKNRYQILGRNVLRADTNTTNASDSLKGSCSEMSRKTHRNSLYELKETARRKFSLIPKVSSLVFLCCCCFFIAHKLRNTAFLHFLRKFFCV